MRAQIGVVSRKSKQSSQVVFETQHHLVNDALEGLCHHHLVAGRERMSCRKLVASVAMLLTCTIGVALHAQDPAGVPLPTGQQLTPLAAPGAHYEPLVAHTGPFPDYVADGAAAIAVSPDKREMLVLTSGFNRFVGPDGKIVPEQSGQYIFRYALDAKGSRLIQTLALPNAYGGISWLPDGRGFVVGGGMDDTLALFARKGSKFVAKGTVALGHAAGLGMDVEPQAAGVAISPDGKRALVANYFNDSVSLVDLATKKVIAEQDLRPGKIDPAAAGKAGGSYPLAVTWPTADQAWVSAARDREVIALSVDGDRISVTHRVATIGEPTNLLALDKGARLLAVEDNADRLAVIDTAGGTVLAEPRLGLPDVLGPTPGKGVNPNALTELPDGRLLVTYGGINALAILTPSATGYAVQGLVPTGWYPSAVAASADGRRIFVANRKSPPGPNPQGCVPRVATYRSQGDACGPANQYIFQLEKAGLLNFPLPDGPALAATTRQVAANIGLEDEAVRAAADAKMAALRQKIRHVIFIVKENRTYDQVLGDLPVGNGDPDLAILGKALSPNHHAIASQFVTLDNFYDSGEQSSTGWTWSTAARATDLLERTAAPNYARRGLAYEAEQTDRFVPTLLTPEERRKANPTLPDDPDLLAGQHLLTAPDADGDDDEAEGQGFLWDAAIRAGLSVRNYGFADVSIYDSEVPGAVPPLRNPFKLGRTVYTAGDPALKDRSDPYFSGFDMKLADFWREQEWEREYGEMEASGTLPALTLLRLSHDHFGDFNDAIDKVNTVETQMADNDYAVGRVVERVAKGREADSTLIFVIEDDAQNGADHVDARRSLALIAGPYVKQRAVVSTRYTTVSLLRTIGAVLGLPPLGLNDALAVPMADIFDLSQDQWSYRATASEVLKTTALPIEADRYSELAMAGALRCPLRSSAYWAAAMAGQDFSSEDRLGTGAFNRALWTGLAGGNAPEARPGDNLSADRGALLKRASLSTVCG
jgi:DNA-binding beta-propeller fold protein YncE